MHQTAERERETVDAGMLIIPLKAVTQGVALDRDAASVQLRNIYRWVVGPGVVRYECCCVVLIQPQLR